MPRPPFAVLAFLAVCAVAGLVAVVALFKHRPPGPGAPEAPPSARLPRSLVPHSYRLVLRLHLRTRPPWDADGGGPAANRTPAFDGTAVVHFRCVERTGTVYLHSRGLWISGPPQVRDRRTDVAVRVAQTAVRDDGSDLLEVALEEPLEGGGEYSLSLRFSGRMSDAPTGLYVGSYEERQGEDAAVRYLAATHLEPTLARTVFPCFDEPDLKAVFNVTIVHRRDTVALSNGPWKGTSVEGDWLFTTFHPTPKMSTYLLAFTVSEFTSVRSTTHDDVEIHTFARPEATSAGQTRYAADLSGRVLKFFEDYFGIKYKQKTLKQVVLPQLEFAGMENWGLITYREDELLYQDHRTPQLSKADIFILIAHEMAHQWFGNLVTMRWWNQIWLNEGFATYMSIIAMDHVEPTFKMSETVVFSELRSALGEDARAFSHPLNPPAADIESYSDIQGVFDDITYSKGASVLRMLADYVGEENFHKGVKRYLSEFSFQNPEQSNLWDCMQGASGRAGVAALMEPWTNQSGFPLITIDTSTGEISQTPFLLNDSLASDAWWRVPVRVMLGSSDPVLIELTSRAAETRSELVSRGGEWILANVNLTGYYRVNYDPENWARLLIQLEMEPRRIPVLNRGQIIDDAFNLARARVVDVTLALDSTVFLGGETEYLPWEAAAGHLRRLATALRSTEAHAPLQAYLRRLVERLYDHFSGYTDESAVPTELSSQHAQFIAVEMACSNGLPRCLAMASKKFGEWMSSDTNRIHPNLRSNIYCHAVAAGGQEEWDFVWDKLQNNDSFLDKDQLFRALSCTTKVSLLNRYLEWVLGGEKLEVDVVLLVLSRLAGNVVGSPLAWNFIREHWERFSERDPEGLILNLVIRMSLHPEVEELERLATEKNLTSSRMISQAIQQARLSVRWITERQHDVLDWLERQNRKSPLT